MNLEQLKELESKATPGPWYIQDGNDSAIADYWTADTDDYGFYGNSVFGGPESLTIALTVGESPSPLQDNPQELANSELIAEMRNQLPELLSTLTNTQEEVARLREVVKTKDAKIEKLASWLDKLAEHAELRAKDTRFITLSEAKGALSE